jgi:hypothetical protein
MKLKHMVEVLIQDDRLCARDLVEASVHKPCRGTRWVASFRDESGRQVWRSTGERDRARALFLAQQWEVAAKRKRETQGAQPRKPTIRVRAGSAEHEAGLLSQAEVAALLHLSERAVREIERRAFDKLRRHPALRDFWREWLAGEVQEAARQVLPDWALSRTEIDAVYALVQTRAERQAARKLIALAQRGSGAGGGGKPISGAGASEKV